jgi:hypothetical protein
MLRPSSTRTHTASRSIRLRGLVGDGLPRACARCLPAVGMAVAWLAVAGLAGCGGSDPAANVAKVGRHTITRALINQWMAPTIGEDYYSVATHEAPLGLVGEPANIPACVDALTKIEPVPGEGPPQPKPTASDLKTKCQQLYEAIRQQTTAFLVGAYWNIDFDASHGITATSQELQQQLKIFETQHYPNPGELNTYLASQHRTLPQLLFHLELQLLSEKLLQKAKAGGPPAYTKLTKEIEASNPPAACSPGYIVEHCKGFKAPEHYPGLSPAVQIQEIARWRPETSHGFTGQPATKSL